MNPNSRPTFPIARSPNSKGADDITADDDFDDLHDLHFMTSVDTNVKQDIVDFTNTTSTKKQHTFEIDDDDDDINESSSSFQPVGVQPNATNTTIGSSGDECTTAGTRASSWLASVSNATSSRTQAILHTLSEDTRVGRMLKESSHPSVAVFHVLFKILALFTYIFGGWLAGASNFVTITVICIIFLACDFWVVKNVSGRLLVGLRWWNKVEEDGSTRWIFESAEHSYNNSFDKMTFWGVTYATPVVWGLLFIVGILKFHFGWLIVVIVALTLSFSNVYGYWKCSTDQKAKLSLMISTGAQMGMTSALQHDVLGRMSQAAGFSMATQQQQQQRGVPHQSGRSTY